ncbi:type IV secretory system conjugative DNA transfer family protein [Ferruginibacter albus]|uniref:type IV secretory system conjugative DNA transfer family protein n=1 Tax=Ferruginibacter albus TaxID=2875540 RepID=UPI001CC33C32|nr:TraM recognition domain-containing protein [Ferruginibacter albus]UAY53183.1 TraM recognition domain-containing protein [Ferruginibacter albus]
MNKFNLDTILIEFSGHNWTARQAVEGTQIFGGIGSGKTSGSGRFLALKYLSAGFGGLVLTAKTDERELWEEYCRLTNRMNDLIVVSPNNNNFFNFLEYESRETESGKSLSENIVQILKAVIQAGEEKDGQSDDQFWESALDMLISNSVDLCLLAYGKVNIQMLYDIVQSLPNKNDNSKDDSKTLTAFEKAYSCAVQNVFSKITAFQSNFSNKEIIGMTELGIADQTIQKNVPEARMLNIIYQFFKETLFKLAEKTRSIIDFSFSGFLYRLLREPVYSLFCSNSSSFLPEDCLKGKIILIDLPVKTFHKVGRDSQILIKYIWQRAMEKRNIRDNDVPVFLWADEAQHFLHPHDADYQATARSSRIATVYISQNLPNYYASMGGPKADYKVKSFLGTLGTKLFHSNADNETNKYASELIGEAFYLDTSKTASFSGKFSGSNTKSLKIDKAIRPEQFTRLKNGSPGNNFIVEGYMHLQSANLLEGNYLKVAFNQNFKP